MKLLFWLIFRSFKALHCNHESLQVFYFFEWCIATVSRFTRTLRNKKSSKLVKSPVVKSYSVHFMSTKTCKESAFSNFQNPLFCVIADFCPSWCFFYAAQSSNKTCIFGNNTSVEQAKTLKTEKGSKCIWPQPFKCQAHKMVKHTQTIRRQQFKSFESVWKFCGVGA